MSASVFTEAPSRARRHLQEVEVYSKLYYSDRVGPAVTERLKMDGGNGRSRIAVIREVTKELYQGEDDEVKAAVDARALTLREASLNENAQESAIRTPQQLQE